MSEDDDEIDVCAFCHVQIDGSNNGDYDPDSFTWCCKNELCLKKFNDGDLPDDA